MGLTRFHDMFHDMFVHWSGLGRAQGTKNEALPVTLQDPQKVPKPKYEATVLNSHPSVGYPNSINGQYTLCTIALLSGEATSKAPRPIRCEQERLPQGGPSFEPLVGALDSR